MSDSKLVVPIYRIIANGGEVTTDDAKGGERRRLFVTLLATPFSVAEGIGTTAPSAPSATDEAATATKPFPLDEWPSQMAAIMRAQAGADTLRMKVVCRRNGELVAGETSIPIEMRRGGAYRNLAAWDSVKEVWQKTLGCTDEAKGNSWADLAMDISESLRGNKRNVNHQSSATPSELTEAKLKELVGKANEDGVTAYGKRVDDALGKYLHMDGALVSLRDKPDATHVILSALSVEQGDFAVSEEVLRAVRVMIKLFQGPAAIHDEAQAELDPPDKGEVEDEKSFRMEASKRYLDVLAATSDQRARSHAIMTQLPQLLEGTDLSSFDGGMLDRLKAGFSQLKADLLQVAQERAQLKIPKRAQVAFALDRQTRTLQGDPPRYQTQEYYVWPERPLHMTAKEQHADDQAGKKPRKTPLPKIGKKDFDERVEFNRSALAHAQAAFFALQSDATLARLFGLAFDCQIDEADLRASIGEIAEDCILYLAPDENPQTAANVKLPVVATAAHLKGERSAPPDAADKKVYLRFWPASVFAALRYVGDLSDNPTTLIDQDDGVFLSSQKLPNDAQRYEVSALDFRRSMAAKGRDRDRGQAMQSAGFTILDRARADQIGRDLALLTHAKKKAQVTGASALDDPQNWLLLHAEELTVGRRVDVTVTSREGDKSNPLGWRSLMQRHVDFDFGRQDRAMESLLRELIPNSKTSKPLIEEQSFQVATRTIPFGQTGDSLSVEAIGEEAIFLWTGAPAAVDVHSGWKSVKSTLPFTRALDLPKTQTPPPLRYGLPYLFRMRAAFVGGGGPSVLEANAADIATVAIPASDGSELRPRRFLRHENILAPILLLPKDLATKSLGDEGVIGFEQLDQAIVRSIDGQGETGERSRFEPEVGGIYVDLAKRQTAEETVRIFVPPEVAPAMLERHGKLDTKAERAKNLRGGLLKVAFKARPKPKPPIRSDQPEKSNQSTALIPPPESFGFPTVVTTRIDGLDSDGALDKRIYVEAGSKGIEGRSGIPVFAPGGRNKGNEGETGYLPDPAVADYCVRLRLRGSERYLDDHILVPVYEGTSYPHVLPLKIVVKTGSAESSHPLSIREVAERAKGLQTTNGVRFQRIDITLAPHQDYDLEVSCLPNVATLARDFALPETIAVQRNAGSDWLDALDETAPQELRVKKIRGGAYTGVGGIAAARPSELESVATSLLSAMRDKWPIEEIAATRRLRVCHARNLPSPPSWHRSVPLTSYRPQPGANSLWTKEEENEEAVDALIAGIVEIDLAEIDGFDIRATTVGVNGQALDDKQRARSPLSKRSGRWPRVVRGEGDIAYASLQSVYGFSAVADGSVTLPRSDVTLLSVRNLPVHGAISTTRVNMNEVKLFGTVAGNKNTEVSLGALFEVAFAGKAIDQDIALPDGTPDEVYREQFHKRQIKIERPHVFKDTLARKLELSIVAVSRHAADFETAPRYLKKLDKQQHLFRRQSLLRKHQSRASDTKCVWVNSTRRPQACDVRRPEPAFLLERASKQMPDGAIEHTVSRRAVSRIWLGRGWFSSGEGERLGVVLWPPNYGSLTDAQVDKNEVSLAHQGRKTTLSNFEDSDLGGGGAFITRWGGDPIRDDIIPQHGYFIPPTAFGELNAAEASRVASNPHQPDLVTSAKMPVPKRGGTDGKFEEYLTVSLLTYVPCFDPDREEWFVDVDLRTKSAAEPFVRFGLVRYQEHSISEDLKVSEPATVMMQLLPERTITVKRIKPDVAPEAGQQPKGNAMFEILVNGPAGKGAKEIAITPNMGVEIDPEAWKKKSEQLGRPHVRCTLFWERDEGGILTRTPASQDPDTFADLDFLGWGNGELYGNLVWHKSIPIPQADLVAAGQGTLVAYVEEIDRRMPASYRQEPVSLDTMLDPGTFVDSGPRFSARVPVLQVGAQANPKPTVPPSSGK